MWPAEADRKRLDMLLRMASSVLASVQEVGEIIMVAKLSLLMENDSHHLYDPEQLIQWQRATSLLSEGEILVVFPPCSCQSCSQYT